MCDMTQITQAQWNEALSHVQKMMQFAKDLPGMTGIFYVSGCRDLQKRYANKERTEELYNEMISLS